MSSSHATNPLMSLLYENAKTRPHHPALYSSRGQYNYLQTWNAASRISLGLQQLGLPERTTVAMLTEKTAESAFCLWAGWIEGYSMLPIPPSEPIARIEFLFALSRPQLVMTTTKQLSKILNVLTTRKGWLKEQMPSLLFLDSPQQVSNSLVLELERASRSKIPFGFLNQILKLEDLDQSIDSQRAMEIENSLQGRMPGETLIPPWSSDPQETLTLYSGDALYDVAAWQSHHLQWNESTRTLSTFPFWQEAAIVETMAVAIAGGTLNLATTAEVNLPQYFVEALDKQKINQLHLTPGQLIGLLDQVNVGPEIFSSIENIVFCHELIRPNQLRGIRQIFKSTNMHQFFYPKRSLVALHHKLQDGQTYPDGIPLGEVCPFAEIELVDDLSPQLKMALDEISPAMDPVTAPSEPAESVENGELVICGPNVGRKYSFKLVSTFGRFAEDDLLSTDELAFRKSGGDIYSYARKNALLQKRGAWVDPTEIEMQIAQHPEVSAAVLITHFAGRADRKMTAFVLTKTATLKEPDLLHHLRTRISPLVLPDELILSTELPLDTNGNLDRVQLRLWLMEMPQIPSASTKASDELV